LHQNYLKDVRLLKRGSLEDAIDFSGHEQYASRRARVLEVAGV
jgi:hypothetical protein